MAVQHPRSPAAGANARAIAFYGGVGEYDEAGYVDA
jgi:hypothetical protein